MARWFSKIIGTENYFEPLGQAIEYFAAQYEEAKLDLRPNKSTRIVDASWNLPGITEHRWGQLQELEAILNFMNIQYDKVKGEKKRNFLEHYNRQLTERLADQYADIDSDVVLIREFIQQVALVRNQYLGITKGLEVLHYQIGYIGKLKSAGVEDATF